MKAKPIFIVIMPLGSENDLEMVRETQKRIESIMPDYHVLVFMEDREDVKFEAFYEKDFNKVKFEELKRIVTDSMK